MTNQAKVQYLYVIEHSYVGRPHIHIQLGPMNLSTTQMKELWVKTGGGKASKLARYKASKGSWYTVKEWLQSDHKGIDIRGME